MTSSTHPARHHIAWLYYFSSPGTGPARIGGPFFNSGTNDDIEILKTYLAEDNFRVDYVKKITEFVYPVEERETIPKDACLSGTSITGVAHMVMVKFEHNETVLEACKKAVDDQKPITLWIVFQPDLPLYEELVGNAWDFANIINTTIAPGSLRFNVGVVGAPISSYADHDETLKAVGELLKSKGGREYLTGGSHHDLNREISCHFLHKENVITFLVGIYKIVLPGMIEGARVHG